MSRVDPSISPVINTLIHLESGQNWLMNLPYYRSTFAYICKTNPTPLASRLAPLEIKPEIVALAARGEAKLELKLSLYI